MYQSIGQTVESIGIPTWHKVKVGKDDNFDFHIEYIKSGIEDLNEFINVLESKKSNQIDTTSERWEQLSYQTLSRILQGEKVKTIDQPGLIYLGVWSQFEGCYVNSSDPKFIPILFGSLAFVKPLDKNLV